MQLPPRAQATVLLTVPFPGEGSGAVSPLTPTEWGRFAGWLNARSMSPENLLSASLPQLLRGLDDKTIRPERVEALLARGAALGLLMDKWGRAGIWVMTRADADYPPRLKKHLGAVSPAVLFGCGNRRLLSGGGLAVVGSRNAGPDDLAYSRRLGELASASGQSVVSGAARGVDEAAMLGALESEGTAVGVLANDLLQTSTTARFRAYIAGNSLTFVSAANPEAGFSVGNAMGRNKYIYCLADAAVVVHSGPKGGTWSGATENLRKEWVPLWIRDAGDEGGGNRLLLNQPGARLLPADVDQVSLADLFAPSNATGIDAPANASSQVLLPPVLEESQPQIPWLESPAAVDWPIASTPTQPTAVPEMTLYDLFLRQVLALCHDAPCRPDELQQALGLQGTQLDVWLKQAVAEGQLTKLVKPVRYQSGRQGTLLKD